MKFENGIVIQQCPVGLVKIDISRKKIVKYTIKEDEEYSPLYDGVIYPCEIEFDIYIKRGWTLTSYFPESILFNIVNIDNVLMLEEDYIVWDLNGKRVYI